MRLGDNSIGIWVGADDRSELHNEAMYKRGCPWRQHRKSGRRGGAVAAADTEIVSEECSMPNSTYPHAAEGGLFNLQSAFLESLKTLLRKYGTSAAEYVDTYQK